MMLEFVSRLELCIFYIHLYICLTSSYVSNFSRSETLFQLSYQYLESTSLEGSKIYQFKLEGNETFDENTLGKFIEKIDISVIIQNKTFRTVEKLSNEYTETIIDFYEDRPRNQTNGVDFGSEHKFETMELKIGTTLNTDKYGRDQTSEELSIIWNKGTEKDLNSSCGKTVCRNVESLFEKWLMNKDIFNIVSLTINNTEDNFLVTNDNLDYLSMIKVDVYLSEPVCNFDDTCSWANNSDDFIRWDITKKTNRIKLPEKDTQGDEMNILPDGVVKLSSSKHFTSSSGSGPPNNSQNHIFGLLYIPGDDNYFSVKITSPVIMGSGNACKLSFRMVVKKFVGFLVRIITSQTTFTVHVYKNPNLSKNWEFKEFLLGRINVPFRVEIELFVLNKLVSQIAIDDISLENCTYIPGGLQNCNDGKFQCSTGLCVERQSTCNLQIDCLNGEDESDNLCGFDKNFLCDFEGSENCTFIQIQSVQRHGVIMTRSTEEDSYAINSIGPFMLFDHTRKSYNGNVMFFEIEPGKNQVKFKTVDLPALPENIIMNKTCKIHMSYYFFDDFAMNGQPHIDGLLFQNGQQVYKSKIEEIDDGSSRIDDPTWKTIALAAENINSTNYHWEFTIRYLSHAYFYLDDIYLLPECYKQDNDTVVSRNTEFPNTKIKDTIASQLIPGPLIAVFIISFAFVVFAVTFYVYNRGFARCRRRKRKHLIVSDKNYQGHLTCLMDSSEMLLRLNNVMAERNPEYDWSNTRTLNEIINSIPRSRLHIISLIGRGQFGEVHKATLLPRSITGKPIHVAIKKLPINSSDQDKADFFLEAVTLSKFKHPNIVDCIGIATDQNMLLLVLEYMNGGDLKCFLRDSRPSQDTTGTLTIAELTSLATDIAKGCWYLQQNKFVHRDIAARNCLVMCSGVTRIAKIADFGLARDVVLSDYYRKFGSAMLPVRWMPPESILEGYFSATSDVWSFGVLLWEIYSYGYLPYPGMSNTEVISFITSGGRLSQTTNCPVEIYRLMTDCWNQSPSERPSFKKVLSRLEEIRKSMTILPVSADGLEVIFRRQRLNTYDCPDGSPLITSKRTADDAADEQFDENGDH